MIMTIEEKAKRYDESIEVAQRFYNNSAAITKKGLEDIFPELKESEDEKMRAMAIKAVYAPEAQSCIKSWGINPDDVISWLEKQGEKAKYHDICDKCVRQPTCQSDCFLQQGEQNPAWSEQDEEIIEALISLCDEAQDNIPQLSALKNWLKSIKDRVQLQPKQEWSEWDRILLDSSISYLCNLRDTFEAQGWDKEQIQKCINFLKSLTQNKWKPSEEQMKILRYLDNGTPLNSFDKRVLKGLIEELNELKK